MPVLVTGATGLVGNNVARRLREHGCDVRVLVREGSDPRPLEGLEVDIACGDLRDRSAVRRACEGVGAVIHAAALIQIGWTRLEVAREINVDGTRNVAEAARDMAVRLVHVSTVDTLGVGSPERPATEDSPRTGKVPCTYVVSKLEADAVVRQLVDKDGLDAVLVHPGFMLGPWDWKPSSGRMLLAVAQRFTPMAPTGGCSFCDVRDVADGILAAWQRGQTGREYILAGENLSYFQAWRLFAEVTGGGRPWFRAGPLMRVAGGRAGDLWGRLTGREPEVNSAAVGMSSLYHYYSSERAKTELGYRQSRPFRETVQDAWNWFREYGYA
jgi:dihydroflavonol-4-reductase